MKQTDDAIRQANRRALPKFLLILVCASLVGGTAGYCAAYFGLDGLADVLAQAGTFFSLYIAPWLLVACAVLQPAVCIPLYRSAKKAFLSWDGEDEAVSGQIDQRLSITLWISGMFSLVSLFLMGASYAGPILDEEGPHFLNLLIVPIFFVLFMVENILLHQRVVDLAKRMAPEKKASVYDVKFQKKWFESCDEAEKLLIGQCAYNAFSATTGVCSALWLVFTLSAMFLNTGFLPLLAVCLIWGVSQCTYSYWAFRLSQPGAKVL
ncbi:MAG TPA: DUF3169 family protein [Candidatus Enterenecus merdae]|nr:DUF3169 family protein [Candidatus Enterenecus merdae]